MWEEMGIPILALLGGLFVIFLAAELFTNALEIVGERLGVSEGVTGSIFAAVGTAMPETIVPIVAILAGGGGEQVNHAVGLGAILGAPFMLSTLAFCLLAFASVGQRGWNGRLHAEPTGIRRDLNVFIAGYGAAVLYALQPFHPRGADVIVAVSLAVGYFLYLLRTIGASRALVEKGHGTKADHVLYASRWLGNRDWLAFAQLGLALMFLIWGARLFVYGVETLSTEFGLSPFLISLLIVPVATELPEKMNSILWIRRKKDTLAFGNITGAMAFQGTLIPAIGMLLMPWHVELFSHAASSSLLTLMAAGWLLWSLRSGRFKVAHLMVNGVFYLVFFCIALLTLRG